MPRKEFKPTRAQIKKWKEDVRTSLTLGTVLHQYMAGQKTAEDVRQAMTAFISMCNRLKTDPDLKAIEEIHKQMARDEPETMQTFLRLLEDGQKIMTKLLAQYPSRKIH